MSTNRPSEPCSGSHNNLWAIEEQISAQLRHAKSVVEYLEGELENVFKLRVRQNVVDHRQMLNAPLLNLLKAHQYHYDTQEENLLPDWAVECIENIGRVIAFAENRGHIVMFNTQEKNELDAVFEKYTKAIECGPEYPKHSRVDGDPGEPNYEKMIRLIQDANKHT